MVDYVLKRDNCLVYDGVVAHFKQVSKLVDHLSYNFLINSATKSNLSQAFHSFDLD